MLTEVASKSSFFLLRDRIERALANAILSFGDKTKLRDACEYALLSGGKRFRSIVVMMLAEALGNELDVTASAVAVEFFHAASLILDDLPCMDNDDERRDRPSLHKAYGEATALLASYSLVFSGYSKICENGHILALAPPPFCFSSEKATVLAVSEGSRLAGILGATGGQFLDLYPPTASYDLVREIVYKKTATLFEISFVLGWLFGGGSIDALDKVRQTAIHLGFAFQIADDISDFKEDEKEKEQTNVVRIVGIERALDLFYKESKGLQEGLISLGVYTPAFEKLEQILYKQVKQNQLRKGKSS